MAAVSSSRTSALLSLLLGIWTFGSPIHAFTIVQPNNNGPGMSACNQRLKTSKPHSNFPLQAKKQYASISADGDGKNVRMTGSLGKPSKTKKAKDNKNTAKSPMSKKDRQRTANGTVNSNSNITQIATTNPADQQGVQVVRASRGIKTVTMIRGMTATSNDDKKKLLKQLKSQLGVGGTLVDGVLEIQGSDQIDRVVDLLKGLGYAKARKIGK